MAHSNDPVTIVIKVQLDHESIARVSETFGEMFDRVSRLIAQAASIPPDTAQKLADAFIASAGRSSSTVTEVTNRIYESMKAAAAEEMTQHRFFGRSHGAEPFCANNCGVRFENADEVPCWSVRHHDYPDGGLSETSACANGCGVPPTVNAPCSPVTS